MSLKDQIISDVANLFQRTDDFAEPIQLVNQDGSITINTDAIVWEDTDQEETGIEGTFNIKAFRVFVSTIDAPDIDRTWRVVIDGDALPINIIGEDDRIAGTFLHVIRDVPKERAREGFRRLRR